MTLPNNIDECWVGEGTAPTSETNLAKPLAAVYAPLPDMTAFELQELLPYTLLGRTLHSKEQLSAGALRHLKFPTEDYVSNARFIDDPKYRMVMDGLRDDPGVHRITDQEMGADEDTLTVGKDVWVPPYLRERWKARFDQKKIEFVP